LGAAPLMQALHPDQDGSLSPAEIEHAANALAKLDKNGDGTLSTDELRPAQGGPGDAGRPPGAPGRPGQAGGAMTGEMLTRMFETRDADKDGKLTGDEIPERMRQNLERVDANKDGGIDKTELQQAMARMAGAAGRNPAGRPEGGRRGQGGGGEGVRPGRPDGECVRVSVKRFAVIDQPSGVPAAAADAGWLHRCL
ncbi:MAG: hypothetical protein ACK5MO_10085, partial [Planctomyces sp.]